MLQNFENIKLTIPNYELINFIILSLFFLIIILSTTGKNQRSIGLLHIRHTNQLKGLAIFFVILGHLWIHVSADRPFPVLSGDAVAMFLVLSGFGLTISSGIEKIKLKDFLRKRIHRVMVPYWITTVIIFILDYILLGKILNTKNIILTFIGVNIRPELEHLDYVRWFVTFILVWYALFLLCHNTIRLHARALTYLFLGTCFALFEYYLFHFGWYQFLSFPAGCIIAIYIRQLNAWWKTNQKTVLSFAIIALLINIVYKMTMHSEQIWPHIVQTVPNIVLIFIEEGNSILLSMSLVVIIGYLGESGFESRVLQLLGRYSYELFLIHGVFLIKYNPFIQSPSPFPIVTGFFLLVLFLITMAMGISKISRSVVNEK